MAVSLPDTAGLRNLTAVAWGSGRRGRAEEATPAQGMGQTPDRTYHRGQRQHPGKQFYEIRQQWETLQWMPVSA